MSYIKRENALSQFNLLNCDMHMENGPCMDIIHGFSEGKTTNLLMNIPEESVAPIHSAVLIPFGIGRKRCSNCKRIYSISKLFAAAGGTMPSYCMHCGAKLDRY